MPSKRTLFPTKYPVSPYYIGLDAGTGSIGIAATDHQYNILSEMGRYLSASILFQSAESAKDRRTLRSGRHSRDHEDMRISLIDSVFEQAILAVDSDFFNRRAQSMLLEEDKSVESKNIIFNDPDYTDKDYRREFPTLYHLLSELIHSDKPHDVRLVYIAVAYLVTHRGHFLLSGDFSTAIPVEDLYAEMRDILADNGVNFEPSDIVSFLKVLSNDQGVKEKTKALESAYGPIISASRIDIKYLINLLAGGKVDFFKLFPSVDNTDGEKMSYSLATDISEIEEELTGLFDDYLPVISAAHALYSAAKVNSLMHGFSYPCDAKVERYKQNKRDLKLLKKWVRKNKPELFKKIFIADKEEGNFTDYINRSRVGSGYHEHADAETFCKFLRSHVKEMAESSDPVYRELYRKIENNLFYPYLKGGENALIPMQLHKSELTAILDNASSYLPWLDQSFDADHTYRQAIEAAFSFRVPYYGGPIGNSPRKWCVFDNDTHITPLNYEKEFSAAKSMDNFITNLTGRCPYTGDPVLPRNSLLYVEYCVLNIANTIRVNGQPMLPEVKKHLVYDFLLTIRGGTTKKAIEKWLVSKSYIDKTDMISGIDDKVAINAAPFTDFKGILDKTGDREMVEKIIKAVTLFGSEKNKLMEWVRDNTHEINAADRKLIKRLSYNGWGRLSEAFLTKIVDTDDATGEICTVIETMRSQSVNLSQILSASYNFAASAEMYRQYHYGDITNVEDYMETQYLSPSEKKTIRHTLDAVAEYVKIKKAAPDRIFVEMSRDGEDAADKSRTSSRKETLLSLYQSKSAGKPLCDTYPDVYEELKKETDSTLVQSKVFLYYTQLGRCMYTGKRINRSQINVSSLWDRDHIWPRSKTNDDSLHNNLVLVDRIINETVKSDKYPLPENIRTEMSAFWSTLKKYKLISDMKYNRLVRTTELSDQELQSYVAADLNSVRRSTKVLADILKKIYPETTIVYVKARHVSDFRQKYDIVKFRELNNRHHAEDAYLNIVVGNVYYSKYTKQFFASHARYSAARTFDFDVPNAWIAGEQGTLSRVLQMLSSVKPTVTLNTKPNMGAFWDQRIQRPSDKTRLQNRKDNLPVEKYGGYTGAKAAYAALVEYTKKGKRELALAPIYVYEEKQYQADPEKVLVAKGYMNPTIHVKSIYAGTLMQIGSSYYRLSSIQPNVFYMYNASELEMPKEYSKYLKLASADLKRMHGNRSSFVLSPDRYSSEKNCEMYDLLIAKSKSAAFRDTISSEKASLTSKLEMGRNGFKQLSIADQLSVLLAVLPAFQASPTYTNAKSEKAMYEIGIKGSLGRIQKNTVISSWMKEGDAFKLLNESVTGFYRSVCFSIFTTM